MIFGILSKEWSLVELYENVTYFLVVIKTVKILAYINNCIVTKNVNNFETLQQIFL